MQIRTSPHFKLFMCIANIWPKSEKTAVKFLNIIDDNHYNCRSWDFEHRNLSEMLFISPLTHANIESFREQGSGFCSIYTLRLSCSMLALSEQPSKLKFEEWVCQISQVNTPVLACEVVFILLSILTDHGSLLKF